MTGEKPFAAVDRTVAGFRGDSNSWNTLEEVASCEQNEPAMLTNPRWCGATRVRSHLAGIFSNFHDRALLGSIWCRFFCVKEMSDGGS